MDIETYSKPSPAGKNSSNAATRQRAVASNWISYLFKPNETGLICMTEIMNDPEFEAAIFQLRNDQKAEFAKISPKSLEEWKTRVFPERDANLPAKQDKFYQQRTKQNMILAREEFVNDTGPHRRIRRNADHAKVQNLVHELMLTQKYANTSGLTAGKIFQHQLDKSLLNDPDAVEKIKAAAIGIRDCFPKNMPVVITFHEDNGKWHFQGWASDRTFNKELGTWDKDHECLDVGGIGQLRKSVDEAVLKATGTVFGNPEKKLDPDRPKRDIYDKHVNSRIRYHITTMSHADYAAGKAIELEQHPKAKAAIRQHVAQVIYDDNKRTAAEAVKMKPRRESLVQIYDEIDAAYQQGLKGKSISEITAPKKVVSLVKTTPSASLVKITAKQVVSLEKKAEYLDDMDASKMSLSDWMKGRDEQRGVEADLQAATVPAASPDTVIPKPTKQMFDMDYLHKLAQQVSQLHPEKAAISTEPLIPAIVSVPENQMHETVDLVTPEQLEEVNAVVKTAPAPKTPTAKKL